MQWIYVASSIGLGNKWGSVGRPDSVWNGGVGAAESASPQPGDPYSAVWFIRSIVAVAALVKRRVA